MKHKRTVGGWFFDSYRHSLAAKKIRTGRKVKRVPRKKTLLDARTKWRFFAFKDGTGIFEKGISKLHEVGKDVRQQNVNVLQQEVVGKLQANEEKMWRGSVEKFMDDTFIPESNFYLNGTVDRVQYENEIRRKLDDFINRNCNDHIGAFDWAKKEAV